MKNFLLVVFSALMEKNPVKTLSSRAPVVLSASRVVVVGLVATWIAVVVLRPSLLATWPVATLGVGLAFSLPLTGAIAKLSPEEIVAFGGEILRRFGAGSAPATVRAEPRSLLRGTGPSPDYERPPGMIDDSEGLVYEEGER